MTTSTNSNLCVVRENKDVPIGAVVHRIDGKGLDVWESWLGVIFHRDGLISVRELVGSFRRPPPAIKRVRDAEKARAFLARCKRTAGRVLE